MSTHAQRAGPADGLRRHWRRIAMLVVVAVLAHAAALSGLEWAWPQREAAALPSTPMQVRVLAPEPTEAPPVGRVDRPVGAVAAPTRAAPVPVVSAVAPQRSTQAIAAAPEPAPEPAAEPIDTPSPTQAAITTDGRSADAAVELAIPLYATQIPPAVRLRYELRRGAQSGTSELVWRPQAQAYQLLFDGRLGQRLMISQASAGGFDAGGLAPLRFTEQRGRRPVQAANFQRVAGSDGGKVTFSGPGVEFALRPGMQDRLSWMLQIAAIAAAEPALRAAGAKVALRVVGVHGDVGVWVFRCLGVDAVDGDTGPVDTIAFLREPLEPYDTTVHVWLDPLRHYLPAQARIKAGPSDPGLVLLLQDVQPLPPE